MTAPQERPAGRPTCGARPAGAPPNRRSHGFNEFCRLLELGVTEAVAEVLAWPPLRDDDERAYWRALQSQCQPTSAQRTAHAAAQRERRSTLTTSRRSA